MTPGTSFAMNSAFRSDVNGQIPATIGMRTCAIRSRNRSNWSGSNTGCVIANSAPASTFHSKRRTSVRQIDRRGVYADADGESRRGADLIASRIEPTVQIAHEVREPDGVDVEHGGRARIWTHLRRVAGDDEQVPNAHRCRAEQVAEHAQEVAVATGIVRDRFDADLLLDRECSS